MTKSKQYILWGSLILVVFIAGILLSSRVQSWVMANIYAILIPFATLVMGWIWGRFGGGRGNNK